MLNDTMRRLLFVLFASSFVLAAPGCGGAFGLIGDLIDEIDDGGGGGGDDDLVLSVTPVDLTGPYDAMTQTYGDVRFEGEGIVPFGFDLDGMGKLSPAFEYITVLDAPVRAATHGFVDAVEFDAGSMDWEIRITQGGRWTVIYDHVLNLTVSEGDVVEAGDQLGTAGNWSMTAGRTELQVNDDDADGFSFCPLDFGTDEFNAAHEALRAAVDANLTPRPSLCLVGSVDPG